MNALTLFLIFNSTMALCLNILRRNVQPIRLCNDSWRGDGVVSVGAVVQEFLATAYYFDRTSAVHRWRGCRLACLRRSVGYVLCYRHFDVNRHRNQKLYFAGGLRDRKTSTRHGTSSSLNSIRFGTCPPDFNDYHCNGGGNDPGSVCLRCRCGIPRTNGNRRYLRLNRLHLIEPSVRASGLFFNG